MDVQECATVGRRTPAHGTPDQSPDGGRTTAPDGLQPTGQSKDPGRFFPPSTGCAVSPYQRQNPGIPSRPPARHFGGHKKKELVGDFKNNGRKLRPKGDAGEGASVRLCDSGTRAGGPLWGVRCDTQRGMGERGSGSRYRGLCGPEHAPLVAMDGSPDLSASGTAVHHGGFRWQQRRSGAALENGTAEAGRRNRPGDFHLPLSAGHQQVEQDRAPAVLLHQSKLARQTLEVKVIR